jgi:hypothetical protein
MEVRSCEECGKPHANGLCNPKIDEMIKKCHTEQLKAALKMASRNFGTLKELIEKPSDYDKYERQRLADMLFDFLRDAYSEAMMEDKASLAQITCFIHKWLKTHFPMPFHDPFCKECEEINSGNPQGSPSPIKPFIDLEDGA